MSSKKKVLSLLEQNRGRVLSGEELAAQIGVTRASVWKAVKELQKDGYQIEGVTNKGYCLGTQNDILSREGIMARLTRGSEWQDVLVYDSLPSTNNEAKRLLSAGAEPALLVVANHQSQGRGRMGRSFYSPKDQGIYMSVALRLGLKAQDALLVTTAASVAVCRGIDALCGAKTQIKWVNDILLEGKKIAGILTEGITDLESGLLESVVVGIGINYTDSDFPQEIAAKAGALYRPDDPKSSRDYLIALIAEELKALADKLPENSFLEEYRSRSAVLGKELRIISGEQQWIGHAQEISPRGGLIVRLADGSLQELGSGEVSLRGEFYPE